MKRKELVEVIAQRMMAVRKAFRLSRRKMAYKLNSSESSIYKNEKAHTSPNLTSYYALARKLNVSLDWMIAGKGEMFYKEPSPQPELQTEEPEQSVEKIDPGDQALRNDVAELLEHMEHIPLLRYKVLTLFHEFKRDNKDLVAETMKEL